MVTIRRIALADLIAIRFWPKVRKTESCWTWTAGRNSDGYGKFGVAGFAAGAHRVAWELATGETLTSHDTICHTCDTPACVRNDEPGVYWAGGALRPRFGHLYKATQPANVADRDAKVRGRWATGDDHGTRRHPETVPRGRTHGNAKLSEDQVRAIRAGYTGKYGNAIALGREFGISANQARLIGRRKAWAHVA